MPTCGQYKNTNYVISFLFMLSLWNPVHILHLQHIPISTSCPVAAVLDSAILGGGDCQVVDYNDWISEERDQFGIIFMEEKARWQDGICKRENARGRANPRQNGVIIHFIRVWLPHWTAWPQKRDELIIVIQFMFSYVALLFSLLFAGTLFMYLSTVHLLLTTM